MNRIRPSAAAFSLGIAALLLMAVKSAASVVTNVHSPVSGSVTNPCNGEIVKFTGVEHLIATVTIDRSGGFHLTAHENIHITATGNLGSSYEGNQENTFEFNGRVGDEQTFVLNLSAISKGSAPNFELHVLQHETVNPNGTVTSLVDHSTASCRG